MRTKISKSQAVRDYLTKKPEERTKDVVEALKEQKINVTPNLVSTIRTKLREGNTTVGTGRGRKIRGVQQKKEEMQQTNGHATFSEYLEAARVAKKLGGVLRAKELMDDLSKLEAVNYQEV